MMKLNIDLPDNLKVTRLDFGYVAAFHSHPWNCWLQVEGKFYRGQGDSMQDAFDKMKTNLDQNITVFEQSKPRYKQNITEIF